MAFLGSETAAVVATVALLSHDTFVHYCYSSSKAHGFDLIMSHVNHRRSQPFVQFVDFVTHFYAKFGIKI